MISKTLSGGNVLAATLKQNIIMEFLRISLLFAVTAVAEILGCYLPWLVLKQNKSAWLLTLHPTAAGRTYAAYGGMYIVIALVWLHFVEGMVLTRWDVAGACVALMGMAIIALQLMAEA